MAFRRLVLLALGLWVVRWLALELASLAGHKWLEQRTLPVDSPRAPGWMPTPFDRPGAKP
jgi:hypothetical protein